MKSKEPQRSLFPPLSVNLPDDPNKQREDSIFDHNNEHSAIPLIPPKNIAEEIRLPPDPELIPQWFAVLSPRDKSEARKPTGPYSVPQLRNMYKLGEVKDSTLMWHEGDKNWQQLLYHRYLRPKLLQMPIIPKHFLEGSNDEEQQADDKPKQQQAKKVKKSIFDPIVDVPTAAETANIKQMDTFEVSNYCSRCGSFAAAHIPSCGEQIPDLALLRAESGITSSISAEVLPGFLWIGNQASSRISHLNQLGITLSVNCTTNLVGPESCPPVFRCKTLPLKEKFASLDSKDIKAVMDVYERTFDWIEFERLYSDRTAETDPKGKPYRGPTDKFGQPLPNHEDKPKIHRKPKEGEKRPPSRVLLWSRLGMDRACALGMAYLIKKYGVTLQRAWNIVETCRPGMNISPAFEHCLKLWSEKYTLGDKLCQDCMFQSINANNGLKERLESDNEKAYAPFKQEIGEHLSIYGDPTVFMPKLLTSFHVSSAWSGLVDLQLPGLNLGNENIIKLFVALQKSGTSKNLRAIDMRSNNMGYHGVGMICDSFQLEGEGMENCSLTALDVSHNRLDDDSGKCIAQFLKQCTTIISLDISHNRLEDDGAAAIFTILSKPIADMFEAEDDGEVDYNISLTDLRISDNSLSHEAAEVLVESIKKNFTLTRLDIGMNPDVGSRDMKHIMNALRVYNSTIRRLTFNDMPMSLKTMSYIARVVEGQKSGIEAYDFARSQFTSSHIGALESYFPMAKRLMKLDLSGNCFGDEGAEKLANIIIGSVSKSGQKTPPLKYLDVNSCGMTEIGCRKVIEAISKRDCMKYLDISGNRVGPDLADYVNDSLKYSQCEILKFNRCMLQSRGTIGLLNCIRSTMKGSLGATLKSLYLSENGVQDNASFAVHEFMVNNHVIEFIDLGFNKFTSSSHAEFESASVVTSKSPNERKLYELHVNLIGNTCHEHSMQYPNRARSKNLFSYSTKPSQGDIHNGGYSHVPVAAKEHFMEKKRNEQGYLLLNPASLLSKKVIS